MSGFDFEEAKKFLEEREKKAEECTEQKKRHDEEIRNTVLAKTIEILKEEFQGSSIEIYLVGSILQPFQFTDRSDIDIVVKNLQGDRFDLWAKLQLKIDRTIEVIRFEKCHFQEYILKHGLKVI